MLVASLAALSALSEVAPRGLSRYNSNAWSARWALNWGPAAFEFQGVLAEAFHRSSFGRLSHLSLLVDAAAWFALLHRALANACAAARDGGALWGAAWAYPVGAADAYHMEPAATCDAVAECGDGDPIVALGKVLALAALVAQAYSFGRLRLAAAALACFGALAVGGTAWGKSHAWSADSIAAAVCAAAVVRSMGHAFFEVAPPWIFDGDDPQPHFRRAEGFAPRVWWRYIVGARRPHPPPPAGPTPDGPTPDAVAFAQSTGPTLRSCSSLLWAPLIGVLSEAHAGLPHRLPHYLLYTLCRCVDGAVAERVHSIAARIYTHGMHAWSVTHAMYALPQRAAPSVSVGTAPPR